MPDEAWRKLHEPYVFYRSGADDFANTKLKADRPQHSIGSVLGDQAPSLEYNPFFKSDAKGATIDMFLDGWVGKYMSTNRITYQYRWGDLLPDLQGSLTCKAIDGCIAAKSIRRLNNDKPREDEILGDPRFGAPYTSIYSSFMDFQRVVAFLWMRAMFVDRKE